MKPLRRISATRYVTPLREGGSVPAIVEGSDDGMYVVKFRGAAQGVKALIAELIAGELGRALGLRVPELVLMDVDPVLGRSEPYEEIRDLIKASGGLNIALDYLPGSITFDPVAGPFPDPREASSIVWFDSFVTNIDRTARNPNLLHWHKNLWLIDHGASLFFHHSWNDPLEKAKSAFPHIKSHVLLRWATELSKVDAQLAAVLTDELIHDITEQLPDDWLSNEPHFNSPAEHRAAYAEYLRARVAGPRPFVEEAERARAI